MPEPGEVREGLVWTGNAWVPLRPAGTEPEPVSKGPPIDPSEIAQASNPRTTGSGFSNTCPVCEKDDRVTRISGLLDSASTKTTGRATTGGVGLGTGGTGGIGVGVGATGFEADSVSKLVQRFAPPALPKGNGCLISVFTFIAILGMTSIYSSAVGNTNSIGWYVLAIGIIVAMIFTYRYMNAPRIRKAAAWHGCLQELRSGYYCARDDVAFGAGGTEAYTPEAFVAATFKPYFSSR